MKLGEHKVRGSIEFKGIFRFLKTRLCYHKKWGDCWHKVEIDFDD